MKDLSNIHRLIGIVLAMVVSMLSACSAERPVETEKQYPYLAYVGTYTRGGSEGIYVFQFDPATGEATSPELAAKSTDPGFLAVHPNGRFLYAVNENADYDEQKSGAVSAFAIDKQTGQLTFLNQVASRGGNPCHLVLDETGKNLMVANYGGGNLAAFPVGEDGRLGEASSIAQHSGSSVNPERQEGPHAHGAALSPDGRLVFVADLGADEVFAHRLDAAAGTLTPNDPPLVRVNPGAGPRHFAFHPSGAFAYVINELQSTVTAFTYEAGAGALTTLQTISTLPEDFSGNNSTAEIAVHPSGKFLYGSNRGHDSIAVFAVDSASGKLTAVQYEPTQGHTPRNFAIDPTGAYLFAANQESDSIVIFQIDQETGRLTPTGNTLKSPIPVCIVFVAR